MILAIFILNQNLVYFLQFAEVGPSGCGSWCLVCESMWENRKPGGENNKFTFSTGFFGTFKKPHYPSKHVSPFLTPMHSNKHVVLPNVLSYKTFFFHTDIFIIADDQVVEDFDSHHFTAFNEPVCHLNILSRWCRVS